MKNAEMIALWRKAGMTLVLHDEIFHPEADDDIWIPAVSSKEWIIVTADKAMEREHLESVIEHRARILLLIDNSSGAPQWAAAMIRCLDQSCDLIRSLERPCIIRLAKFGTVTLIRGPASLAERLQRFKTARIVRTKRHRKAS